MTTQYQAQQQLPHGASEMQLAIHNAQSADNVPTAAAPAPAAPLHASRFVLLVECTAALLPFWHNLRAVYVEPMLTFVDRQMAGTVEMALVLVQASDHTSDHPVDSSGGWTTSVSELRSMLDALQFVGGGFGSIALMQGLAQVVYLQSLPSSLSGAAAQLASQAAAPGADAQQPAAGAAGSVPCFCLQVCVSPYDRTPAFVPGVPRRPAPARPALTYMHDYQTLLRSMRAACNVHLSFAGCQFRCAAAAASGQGWWGKWGAGREGKQERAGGARRGSTHVRRRAPSPGRSTCAPGTLGA